MFSFGYFIFLSSQTYMDVLSISIMPLSKVIVTYLKLVVNRQLLLHQSTIVNRTKERRVSQSCKHMLAVTKTTVLFLFVRFAFSMKGTVLV